MLLAALLLQNIDPVQVRQPGYAEIRAIKFLSDEEAAQWKGRR